MRCREGKRVWRAVCRLRFGDVSVIYRVSIVYLTCIYRICNVYLTFLTREKQGKYEAREKRGKLKRDEWKARKS